MKDIVSIYRDLHRIPELSNKEYKTKQYIKVLLEKLDGEIIEVGNTCILFYRDFNRDETIAFRSDMDGLPINEKNDFEYISNNPGVMHACGHDGHMSILLKLCEYVSILQDCKYNILCIFQEGEENLTGAKIILSGNILNTWNIKYIFGMHIWPGLEKGKIFSKSGPILASATEVDVIFKGNPVHICNKDKGVDSIRMAMDFIKMVYDKNDIWENGLYHFGKINGGIVRNVVAGETKLEGSIRVYSKEEFNNIMDFFNKKMELVMEKYGGKAEMILHNSSACVVNDILVEKLEFVDIIDNRYFQGEDFGFYCEKYRSVFFLLGSGNSPMLHSNNFCFDETILNNGYECYKNVIMHI